MLSPFDDYPIHQIAEPIRTVGTSDRNFYDRYYFNCHPCGADTFLVTGMGQYPNLGVQDAFAVILRNGVHRVVRASRALGNDRMDTTVGPFHIDVIEGLKRLRVRLEPNEWDVDFDLTFEGAMPAFEEPRHLVRQGERITFDSKRLAQTGCWSGTIHVAGETFEVTPDHWWGTRDRSWGVRPVGEPEPPGIRATIPPTGFYWIYAPMQFEDYSLLFIVQEDTDGTRVLEEAVRVWAVGHSKEGQWEHLGRPVPEITYSPGTRMATSARLHLGANVTVEVEPELPLFVGVGTGYGFDADWRHGMWQGDLVVQGRVWNTNDPAVAGTMWGLVDNVARFTNLEDGAVGHGLFEHGVFGPHHASGFKGWEDNAP